MSGLKDFASPMGIGTRLFNCLRKPFLGVSCPQVSDLQPQMGIPGRFGLNVAGTSAPLRERLF